MFSKIPRGHSTPIGSRRQVGNLPNWCTGIILFINVAYGTPLQWWVMGPLEKVKASDAAPPEPLAEADVFAARNEFEPFQIVMRSDDGAVRGIDMACSDLRTSAGQQISRDNVTIYAERYMNITRPSLASGTPGEWPDALIPRVDRYAHEARNAFPLTVDTDRNQPVWIEIFVPENAAPGEYSGTVSVTRNGGPEFTVPLHLTVWAFTLPSTSSLRSSFGFSGSAALKRHFNQYTSDEDLFALTRLYETAALLHRVSIHGGSQVPPGYRYQGGDAHVDWGAYDAEVGPFLDGKALGKGPLRGAKATSIDLREPQAFGSTREREAYYDAWVKHFSNKGWLDRLFLYLWDEPAPKDFPKVVERGQIALRAVPDLQTLTTAPVTPKLEDVVRIWTPLINCLENKPNTDDFCFRTPEPEEYARVQEQGKSLWFYQSCASHGCNIAGGDYFEGWPSYMIDAPGTANRVMQWVAFTYGIQGELYYSTDEAYSHGDPWTDVRLFGGNGDGTLFYPGTPEKIGGHAHIPIESIRLKLIREGMEDYEYLTLLARTDADAAAGFAKRIVAAPYAWEGRPEAFLRVRRELGEQLHRMATSSSTDAP